MGDISKLCSGSAAPVMVMPVGGDYRPYELEIARLRGRCQAYEESITQLRGIAKQNKLLHQNTRSIVKDLISMGIITRETANSLMEKHKKELSPEDQALFDADLRINK